MKRLISCMFVLLMVTPAYAGSWSKEDTARQATFLILETADWLQTKEIARNPKYTEINPILGKCPTQNSVDLYFASCAVAHTAIAYCLPSKYRKWWQYVFIGIQAGCVGHNINAGVSINF